MELCESWNVGTLICLEKIIVNIAKRWLGSYKGRLCDRSDELDGRIGRYPMVYRSDSCDVDKTL